MTTRAEGKQMSAAAVKVEERRISAEAGKLQKPVEKANPWWEQFCQEMGLDPDTKPGAAKSQEGKLMVMTGCTTAEGIGYGVVRMMCHLGCACILLTRDLDKATTRVLPQLVKDGVFESEEAAKEKILFVPCEMISFASVHECCKKHLLGEGTEGKGVFDIKKNKIDYILNNAAIMALPVAMTEDDHDWQIQTNHLSHFIIQSYLHPYLNQSGARVVQVASSAAWMMGDMVDVETKFKKTNGAWFNGGWKRYAQTKLSNIIFAMECNRREPNKNIHHMSCHPGLCSTHLVLENYGWFGKWTQKFATYQSHLDGATNLLKCLLDEKNVKGGDWCMPSQKELYGMTMKCDVPIKAAYDAEKAKKFWKQTEECCKLEYKLTKDRTE